MKNFQQHPYRHTPESEQTLEAFAASVSAWMEMNFGLAEEEGHLSDVFPFLWKLCQPFRTNPSSSRNPPFSPQADVPLG